MVWQRSGTVAVQNGSTTVTGTSVDFAASSRNGDSFVGPDGATYEVANVASATVISILPAYKGPTASGAAYAIMPVQGYDKMLSDAFNNLNSQFGPKLAALGTTGNYDILPASKGGTGNQAGAATKLSTARKINETPFDGTADVAIDVGYKKSNIVGAVAQASGVPTGAIIERGSNANGEYTKFSDGTMICTGSFTGYTANSGVSKTLAATFVGQPSASFTVFPGFSWDFNCQGFCTASSFAFYSSTTASANRVDFMVIGRWV